MKIWMKNIHLHFDKIRIKYKEIPSKGETLHFFKLL